MDIQLITDGSADFISSIREKYQIKVVPLHIIFGDESFKTEEEISLSMFYEKMKQSTKLPRSAASNPKEFYDVFKEVDPSKPILVFPVSKMISSTYDNAILAKEMLKQEEPERKIEVFHTRTASAGLSILLEEAGRKIKAGMDFETLVPHIKDRIEHTTTLIMLKTLDNLIKGGRLDPIKGTFAKSLNIKLLMRASQEGTIEVAEKVRGSKKTIRRFIEQIGEYSKNFEGKILAMSHFSAEEKAKEILAEMKEKYPFKEVHLTEMGPLISTYAGEGGIVISFFSDKKIE
ncbi:DegV family protein [Bacillaceae bacterium S4-13-58]